ncbi:hypothetical protein [Nocardia sp. NPDC049149]|uniref:hypothetical protein n=1 Tax=Nocardia sp. NPDC049149 TaxID=3364315 RepID=UPI00371D5CE6
MIRAIRAVLVAAVVSAGLLMCFAAPASAAVTSVQCRESGGRVIQVRHPDSIWVTIDVCSGGPHNGEEVLDWV